MKTVYDSHYDVQRLNRVFAISSIALLLCTGWMVWHDYAREWKHYQRDFNQLDLELTQARIESVSAELDQERLDQLAARIEAARQSLAQQRQQSARLEQELAQLEDQLYERDAIFRESKAHFDAAKYEFEETQHRRGEASSAAQAAREALERRSNAFFEAKNALDLKTAARDRKQDQLDQLDIDKSAAEKEREELVKQVNLLQAKAEAIRPSFARSILNLPMLDFIAPPLTIKQTVVAGLYEELNFLQVDRVDRCETCHLAAALPGYETRSVTTVVDGEPQAEEVAIPQPFRSHPRIDIMLDPNSAHPAEKFGCTVCHLGRGRATGFVDAVHVPRDAEQRERWEAEYHWHKLHHWDWPMRPLDLTEAGCLKCHMANVEVPQADKLNRGLMAIERLGCFGCHKMERFADRRKVGPTLRHVASKLAPEFLHKWIEHPASFRPATIMPRFWGLENNSSPPDLARGHAEVDAIVAYLISRSEPIEYPEVGAGDPEGGRTLVTQLGCTGCHTLDEYQTEDLVDPRRRGPNLDNLGSKVSAAWIVRWVTDPKHYFPETRMPDLRLTEQEALDIAAYLSSERSAEFDAAAPPPVDPEIRARLVQELLLESDTLEGAKRRLAQMDDEQRRLFLGEAMISRYGCFGCHEIPGFEDRQPIGVELSKWGDKPLMQLDFGFIEIPETLHDWLDTKLENPRIFDRGKAKQPHEKLRMPRFEALEPADRRSVITAILGMTADPIRPDRKVVLGARGEILERGRMLVQQYNCRGCHIVEGHGGAIRDNIAKQIAGAGRSPEEAGSFSPPNLIGEGQKVQPGWLFEFLMNPTPIRPWLGVRMPTFGFSDDETNAIVAYFAALDQATYPFESPGDYQLTAPQRAAVDTLFSPDYFNCGSCHVRGAQQPEGPPEGWAPDFALAASRLRPEWIPKWLKNPSALMPGTKMPAFFGTSPEEYAESGPDDVFDGSEDLQIEALRNYLISLGRS